MKIYYCFNKGVLRFDCLKKEWHLFFPQKKVKAPRKGELLTKDQTRCYFMNYKQRGKPMVHRGIK